MQNKPKVKYAKMNISPFMTIKYEKLDTWLSGKNKPNFKPNIETVRSGRAEANRICQNGTKNCQSRSYHSAGGKHKKALEKT